MYACAAASLVTRGATIAAPTIQQMLSTAGANAGAAKCASAWSDAEVIAARHTKIKYGSMAAVSPASKTTLRSSRATHAQTPMPISPIITMPEIATTSHRIVAVNSCHAPRRSSLSNRAKTGR